MAEEKKITGKNNSARQRKSKNEMSPAKSSRRQNASAAKSKKRAKRSGKPKVVLSTKKVIVFCACVCCFCAIFLCLSVVLNSVPSKMEIRRGKIQKTEAAQNRTAEKKIDSEKKSEKTDSETSENKKSEKTKILNNESGLKNQIGVEKEKSSGLAKQKSALEKTAQAKPLQKSAVTEKPAFEADSKKTAQKKAGPDLSKSAFQEKSPAPQPAKKTPVEKSAGQKTSSSAVSQKSSEKNKERAQRAGQENQKSSSQKTASAQKDAPKATEVKKSEKKDSNQNQPEKKSAYVAANNQRQNENAQEQARKNPRFDIPKAVNGATVVIIIDDAGRSVENVKKYAMLPFPLTVAVLPHLGKSLECAQTCVSLGKEVILHQPMQSVNHSLDPGPGKITVDMSFAEIEETINQNLLTLGPGVKGMNNHEGSEVTGDVLRIGAVLDVCRQKGIYFLDSRTTAATKAPQAALERGMKIYEKAGPYIDNEISREKMLERMYETLRYANNHGRALVIGHVDKSVNILPDLLNEMYPYMKAAGYKFATPSTLH